MSDSSRHPQRPQSASQSTEETSATPAYGGPAGDGGSSRLSAFPKEDLLERVIAETEVAKLHHESSEFRAICAVARRYPDIATVSDATAVQLIEALLRCHLEAWLLPEPLIRQMAMDLAETLWESPPYRDQLQRLWQHAHLNTARPQEGSR